MHSEWVNRFASRVATQELIDLPPVLPSRIYRFASCVAIWHIQIPRIYLEILKITS